MTAELIVLGTFALVLIFIAVYAMVQPSLTRRDLLFGVTVAPQTRTTQAARRIIRIYRLMTLALTLLGLAGLVAMWALLDAETATIVSAFSAIGIIFVISLPYLWAYFATRRLARAQPPVAPPATPEGPSAELRPRRYGDYVPWVWELLPLAIIGATVAYLVFTYPSVPQNYPTHFDLNGQPNGYSTKSIANYFSLVWTQLGLYALLTLLSVLIVGSRALPGEAETRFRRAWLRFLFVLKTGVLLLLGIIAAAVGYSAVSGVGPPIAFFLVPVIFEVLVLVGSLVLALRTGQGGARLSPNAPATDRTSDRHWILGEIYINREDPSIFVERRFGVGWTLNFGNPRALLVVGMILAFGIGISVIAIIATGK
jgi:uncharacterized membrane protein